MLLLYKSVEETALRERALIKPPTMGEQRGREKQTAKNIKQMQYETHE